MKIKLSVFTAVFVASLSGASLAQDVTVDPPAVVTVDPAQMIRPAAEVTLDEFLWIKRPVVVFADNPADPRYVEQMDLLTSRLDPLDERDVVIITDTDPKARSAVRQELRPRGFSLTVLTKDGTIIFRSPAPRSEREISAAIDAVPLRRQEIRDRLNTVRE
ncbi:DUF4174 domain-containing protein [Tropicibacter naphthalenivorans]|uniref:DUF4174 domain-containing protein n=1 Tax=Tropicibacter naphthalenivorans TaxID=441103 RepID=A0A0P1GKG7_9RHOB|nr:DUF4174 domain-containing protein [Tropicibacter naphthalenivorans]CUH76530.1 hypothetical protein TRN7648_00983 [Tropicibacter naphthalenivorans]SMC65560.1 protein of unknown function [Tropicibacter naphthalenivorans]